MAIEEALIFATRCCAVCAESHAISSGHARYCPRAHRSSFAQELIIQASAMLAHARTLMSFRRFPLNNRSHTDPRRAPARTLRICFCHHAMAFRLPRRACAFCRHTPVRHDHRYARFQTRCRHATLRPFCAPPTMQMPQDARRSPPCPRDAEIICFIAHAHRRHVIAHGISVAAVYLRRCFSEPALSSSERRMSVATTQAVVVLFAE